MSDLPLLVALARSLDRIKTTTGDTPAPQLKNALSRFEPSLKSEDSKRLGQKLVDHFAHSPSERDERVEAILTLALDDIPR
jgi:hypothetical protein